MSPTLVYWSDRLVEAVINGFAPGFLIAALVWAMTRSRARVSAATRFVILWIALAAVVLLPLAALKSLHSRPLPIRVIIAAPTTTPTSLPGVETQSATLTPILAGLSLLDQNPRPPAPVVPQAARRLQPSSTIASMTRSSLQSLWSRYAIPYWSLAAATLWLAAAFVFLFRLGWGFLRLNAWKKHCRPATGRAAEFFQECIQKAGCGRPVRLGFSPHLRTPVLAGLGSPCILFPESLWDQFGEAEREQVLLHELAHLRRWDDWTHLAEHVISALFFFHPVVRWLCARLRLEREIACDDWVLASGQLTRQYALCLTRLAELALRPAGIQPAPGFWFNRAQLSRRVGALLDSRRNGKTSPSTGIVAVTATTFLLSGLVAAAFFPRAAFAAETPLTTPESQRIPSTSSAGPLATANSPDHPLAKTPASNRSSSSTAMEPLPLPPWTSDWVKQMLEASIQVKSDQMLLTTIQNKLDQHPVADWPKLVCPYQTDPESAKLHADLQAAEQKLAMLSAGYRSPKMEEYREAKAALKMINRQLEEKAQGYVAGLVAKLEPFTAKFNAMQDEVEKTRGDGSRDVYAPDIEMKQHLEFLRMTARANFALWQAWSDEFNETADAERRKILPAVIPDNELAGLMNRLHSAEQQAAMLDASDLGPRSEEVRMARAAVLAVQRMVDDKVHGMVAAVKIRAKALKAGYDSMAGEMSRLDIKSELGRATGREADWICRLEVDRIDCHAKRAIRQVLHAELTNTPPEELRSIMGSIDQDPADTRQNNQLVELCGKWQYAKQKMAMFKASDLGPKSDEDRQAEAELRTIEGQLDQTIQLNVGRISLIAGTLKDASENYTAQIETVRAYCAKRDRDLGPNYLEARRGLLADEIKLLQSHLEHDQNPRAKDLLGSELAEKKRELADIEADLQKK